MRLSRIIIAILAGATMVAVPAAAGAAEPFTPQPPLPTTAPPGGTPGPTQPPVPTDSPYPPQPGLLTLSVTTIELGEQVIIRGRAFGSNEQVDISISGTPLAAGVTKIRHADNQAAMIPVVYALPAAAPTKMLVRTNANGAFTVNHRPLETGEFTITATGRTSKITDSVVLVVMPAQQPGGSGSGGGGGLPRTGANVVQAAAVGAGLIAVGAILLVLMRRRRSSSH